MFEAHMAQHRIMVNKVVVNWVRIIRNQKSPK